jgi:uncharacterized protein (DUF427 family)
VKIPRSDRRISLASNPNRVIVKAGGRVIADTRRALTLAEGAYPPVQYIPREDVDMTHLVRSTRITTCPHKGDAAYYSIEIHGSGMAENAAWSYETPRETLAAIREHLAFYPARVDSIEEK